MRTLSEVTLTVDEFEAIRLSDQRGLYQEEAARQMGVSRQTFGRIVDAARKKVATALVEGYAIRIEGGEVQIADMRCFCCSECKHCWEEPRGTGRPTACPSCQGQNIKRIAESADVIGPQARQGRRGRCAAHAKQGHAGGHSRHPAEPS